MGTKLKVAGGKRGDGYVCGAVQINGSLCKAPVRVNGKCSIHVNSPDVYDGFYSKTMTQQECAEFDLISVGEINNELKLARVQLRRALQVQKNVGSDLVRTKEVTHGSGGVDEGVSYVVTKEVVDHSVIINRYLTQIGKLEAVKAQIQQFVVGVNDDAVSGFRDRLDEMGQLFDNDPPPVLPLNLKRNLDAIGG